MFNICNTSDKQPEDAAYKPLLPPCSHLKNASSIVFDLVGWILVLDKEASGICMIDCEGIYQGCLPCPFNCQPESLHIDILRQALCIAGWKKDVKPEEFCVWMMDYLQFMAAYNKWDIFRHNVSVDLLVR